MSNLKKVLALSLVLALALTVAAGASFSYATYTDGETIELVNGNYRIAAEMLNDIGVVVGKTDPDTQGAAQKYMYDPKGEFDRASLARVLYLLDTGFTENSIENSGGAFAGIVVPFKDIDDSWAANYIKYCYSKGLLSGRSSAVFDPTGLVTAQELATAMLALRGYTKADLAKNYPSNVVVYGYTGDCNLFATGLASDVPPDEETTGKYLPGTMNAAGIRNYNQFGDFGLTQALTREQAFYMLHNNLVNGSLVKKLSATVTSGTTESNIVFDTYLDLGTNYLWYKYGIQYYAGTEIGVITGSQKYGLGANKSSGAKTFKVGGEEFQDYGYTATVKQQSKNMATGYTLSPTDWDANIGRKIVMKVVSWGNDTIDSGLKAWGYTFVWDTGNNDPGITGSDVVITKEKKVEVVDDNTIKIDGTEYDLFYNSPGGFFVSTNNAVTTTLLSATDAINALKMGNNKSVDTLTFKLVDGKVYGVFAINTTYAKVSDVDADGKIKTDGNKFGANATATNIAGLAKGDYILAYKDAVDGVIKGTKATKSALTYITVGMGDAAGKYFINGTTTELVFGDADGAQECDPSFITDDDMYYIYTVGNYVYGVEEEEPHVYSEVLVTGKSSYDMHDGKWIYSFTGYVNGNPAQVVTYTTPVINFNVEYAMIQEGDMVTVETTAFGVLVDIDDNSDEYIYADEKESSIGAVDSSDEFYFDTTNQILYVYVRTGLFDWERQAQAIGPETKVYVLKSNYSSSSKTLGDAAVQEVIVADISNDSVVTGTLIIAITNE